MEAKNVQIKIDVDTSELEEALRMLREIETILKRISIPEED